MLSKKNLQGSLLALVCSSTAAATTCPTPQELTAARQWTAEHLCVRAAPVFSFRLGGQESGRLLPQWELSETAAAVDEARTRRVWTYTDPRTGLAARWEAVEYHDYPVVEWTVHLKNTGKQDTPVVEGLQALDAVVGSGAGDPVLHHNVGSPCEARDYQPLETTLGAGVRVRIGAAGGRPTNSDLCYFNLAWEGRGVILALGWPGQWSAEFSREGAGARMRAGQELTRFVLHPGEEARTPLVAALVWEGGDWLRAQNLWRRWFIAHNLRRPGGELPWTQWCGTSEVADNMMVNATVESQTRCVDEYAKRGLHPDFWWMDAGWYPNGGDWTRTGTWEADPARFPHGMRPVFDYLHAHNIRGILWFEPERVRAGTWLATEHPEWILPGPGDGLLDLGNPAAWRWLLNHVDGLISEFGIDIYRQDFNMDPLEHWRAHDAPDRQGMTEMRYVEGLLAYWDELLRRHPKVLYDNCASGGRRNDLESMRRGVPYTKSDYADDPVGAQGETYGIAQWIPYFAATWGTSTDPYLTRSRFAHTVGACLDSRVAGQFKDLPKRLEEWRKVVACYWGDFWPLTPYSLDNAAWMAWQFDVPEEGKGVVQAFRRAECAQEAIRVKLRGLEAGARYKVEDVDAAGARVMTGKELTEEGLELRAGQKPWAVIVTYEKTPA